LLLNGGDLEQDLYDWKTSTLTTDLKCDLPSYKELLKFCFNPLTTANLITANARSICVHDVDAGVKNLFSQPDSDIEDAIQGLDIDARKNVEKLSLFPPSEFCNRIVVRTTEARRKSNDVEEIMKKLNFESTENLWDYIVMLGKTKPNDAHKVTDFLIKMADKSWNILNQNAAMFAIQYRVLNEEEIETIIPLLKDERSSEKRRGAIWILGRATVSSSIIENALVDVLKNVDEANNVRAAAATTLAKILGERMSGDLVEMGRSVIMQIIQHPSFKFVGDSELAKQMKYCGTWDEVADLLLKMMSSTNEWTRKEAGKSISHLTLMAKT